jgi:hypothetical protein
VHTFHHLFVCFQTSVYTLGEVHQNRNNSTVFEELSVSNVDLTVANICFPAIIESTIDTSNSSNTVLLFLNIPGHIIVVVNNIFIGLFWMNCRFQGA